MMKQLVAAICLATAVAVAAQTSTKTSGAAKSTATTAKSGTGATAAGAATYKVPAGEHKMPGLPKTAFSLKYQEIKVGTGPVGEAGKLWHVKYKGWRAADGEVFDNWEEHKRPVLDKDGKPETGADGKPKLGDPEPLVFPEGMGRLIPGFDYGVTGMHVGGKRRLFIPWQLAYGTRAIPDRPDHPGIPAKSDLIFDVELVEVTEMPAPPARPMPGMPGQGAPGQPGAQPGAAPRPSAPGTPPPSGAPATGQPSSPDTSKPSTPPPTEQPQSSPQR